MIFIEIMPLLGSVMGHLFINTGKLGMLIVKTLAMRSLVCFHNGVAPALEFATDMCIKLLQGGFMAKRVGVLLAGCGHRDGAEIHEATCTLIALDKAGCQIVGIAPDLNQLQVTNHIDGSPMGGARNIMVEAARIMRGNIRSAAEVNIGDLDALIIPGGFGAALNFCNYGLAGRNCGIDNSVKGLILGCVKAKKPLGAVCISPIVVAKALEGTGIKVTLTIGSDSNVAADIEYFGAKHEKCKVDDVVIDRANKVVTTPAYMLATRVGEVEAGVTKLVNEVLNMI